MSILQNELKQRVAFTSPAQEAVIGLLRTASLIEHQFATLMGPHGLTFSQYNVLRILRGAEEPLPTMEISARMIEKTPGITRLLDSLEKKALVERERSTEDRRQVLCRITTAGLDLLKKLDEPVDELDACCLSMLSLEEQEQLIELLAAVRSKMT